MPSNASLEHLVENENLGIEVLHPGGFGITHELAGLCRLTEGMLVLDVASGTGESACFLAERFRCTVIGVDVSEMMVKRANRKAAEMKVSASFHRADAHHLPFKENTFDAVVSECATCLLNKQRALKEMLRTAKDGCHVAMHDICWRESTPENLKKKLAQIEGEEPESLKGWSALFSNSGLTDVVAVDKSYLLRTWMNHSRSRLGITGQLRIIYKVLKKWGIRGCGDILASERIFRSDYTGYGMIVGRKM